MSDDANSHQLLAVVSTVSHHGANYSLHNWALSLAEALSLVSASSVGNEGSMLSLNSDEVHQ